MPGENKPMTAAILNRRKLLALGSAGTLASGLARAETCQLRLDFDYHGWAGLQAWSEELKPKVKAWWPDINRALSSTDCGVVKALRFEFYKISPEAIGAAAQGDKILINAPYVLANLTNPDMFRMIAHELTHVAQAYRDDAKPHWMTEGIADYVRYYVLFPDDPGRAFDPGLAKGREGYAPTAGLLAFAEAKRPGLVSQVNAAMRAGKDGEATLVQWTGKDFDTLWVEYLQTKPQAASASKLRSYLESLKPPS